jgi:hypothetical protein
LPSERRRLRKELRATENKAKEETSAVAEAAAMAEADAVLERQSSRPDATSAMLTSVLLKRAGTASPEPGGRAVARTRAKRDLLKVTEMRTRKPKLRRDPDAPCNVCAERSHDRGNIPGTLGLHTVSHARPRNKVVDLDSRSGVLTASWLDSEGAGWCVGKLDTLPFQRYACGRK